MTVPGRNIFELFEDENAYTFTAVLKGIGASWNNYVISAQGFVYSEGDITGELASNVIEATVNDLLN